LPAIDAIRTAKEIAPPIASPASNLDDSNVSNREAKMAASDEMKIVLQVGNELRITKNGEVIVSNPELELAADDNAADAVFFYKFNPSSGEHTLRLAEPVVDHQHAKVHRRGD
jgi:hypothetical protein